MTVSHLHGNSMSSHSRNIRPSWTKRSIAALVAVVGVAVVGSRLAGAWPRDVEVAYEVGPDVRELDVDYVHEQHAVASARFTQSEAKSTVFRHTVRLPPGQYRVQITAYGSSGLAFEGSEALPVPADGLTRFDLRAAARSQ
jgi:hypothetical protein